MCSAAGDDDVPRWRTEKMRDTALLIQKEKMKPVLLPLLKKLGAPGADPKLAAQLPQWKSIYRIVLTGNEGEVALAAGREIPSLLNPA